MAKRKTTIYIDDDVITATKMTAVATHRSDSAVIEDALRSYLGEGHGATARVDLHAVLDRRRPEPG
jgi:predicted transcriptional regulator